MAFQIKDNNGIYELNGNIVFENIYSLKNYLEQLLAISDKVILSVDNVQKIDHQAVSILTEIHRNAMELNKIFWIIGKGNKIAKKAFGKNSYILRNDFL